MSEIMTYFHLQAKVLYKLLFVKSTNREAIYVGCVIFAKINGALLFIRTVTRNMSRLFFRMGTFSVYSKMPLPPQLCTWS